MVSINDQYPYSFKLSVKWRYTYNDNNTNIVWAWITEQYGEPGDRWIWDTYRTFRFKNEEDRNWFILRWS